jgi:galactokinase
VPLGSGLSSSAAFEVAIALAALDAAAHRLPAVEIAAACQEAERLATGVPCGVMDPLASLAGRSGHALAIDCRSLAIRPVPIPSRLGLLAVHSGLPRRLAESAYAERRADCERVAKRLGLAALRDAEPELVRDEPRARHVVAENRRVEETVEALSRGDADALGRLFAASHASLRDDFGVSTPELDALVGALLASGAVAARLTGAGFGGCVVALVERSAADRIAADVVRRHRETTGLEATPIPCRAVAGAGPMRPPRSTFTVSRENS